MRASVLLPALLLAFATQAQRYYFENITVANGLPVTKVYTVLQDSTGLVWLGTESGLASFDGTRVSDLTSGMGLAMGGVSSLFVDKDKRLWCGHLNGGVSVSVGRRFRPVTFAGASITADVKAIVQDPSGAIWFGTVGQGAFRVKEIKEDGDLQVEQFVGADGPGERITSIVRTRAGDLVFLDPGSGLRQWNSSKGKFEPFPLQAWADMEGATCFFEDRNGGFWLGTQDFGAFHWNKGQLSVYDQPNGMPDSFVYALGEDDDGVMWISVWNKGLVRVEKDGLRLFTKGSGLHSQSIRSIVRDHEGNLLLATNDEGLEIYKGDRFMTFAKDDGLVEPHVRAVAQAQDGRIWFGTGDGITVLDPSATGPLSIEQLTSNNSALGNGSVRCLLPQGAGRMWIGTDGGLFEGSVAGGPARSYFDDFVAILADNKVTALSRVGADEIHIGSLNGLIRWAPGRIPLVLRTSDGLAGNEVTALFTDSKGNTWVGSNKAGVSFIPAGDGRKASVIEIGPGVTPTSFTEDQQHRIWVGTQGQGVVVLADGKVVERYDMKAGLLSDHIRSLTTDANGHVWIGTNMGLNELVKDGKTFRAYTERSGFTGIEALGRAVCRTQSGDLWFGTANGANKVVVDHGEIRSDPPQIAVRVLKVNLEEREAIDGVDLSHTERDVRIEFGCVSLIDQGAVRYQFMLEGLEKDWQPVTAATDAHYPGLSPGSYVFKVRARNRSGLWSDPPVSYHFTVLPPWYKSWWFYTAVVLVGAIVLFSYIKVRERQLRLRNLVLEQKVVERTAEVRAQSKEIEGQKARIEDLLLNILPKQVSEELKEKGSATAHRHDEVTVMFTDMKGFTQVAERMRPEELVHELDECFKRFDDIIDRYGIEKIKTIGDSYMCAGGVPTADRWHAHKVVLAGLEVRDLMRAWAEERRSIGQEPWYLRIGIHSGAVVAGVVGKRKFAYDIWGDTVNTASRMESSGSAGELNISSVTYELVKELFECEHRGAIEAKNKGRVEMYFVKRLRKEFAMDPAGSLPNKRLHEMLGLSAIRAHVSEG